MSRGLFQKKTSSMKYIRQFFCVVRNCYVNQETVDSVVLAEKIRNMGISFKDDVDIFDYIEAISFNTINEKGVIEACRELKKAHGKKKPLS